MDTICFTRHNIHFLPLWKVRQSWCPHRASQTLYLSEVIDVNTCKDPAYGKLQVGLYLAAVRDAQNRLKQLKHSAKSTIASSSQARKRPLPDDGTQRPMKKRLRSEVQEAVKADDSDEFFMKEVGCRNLALVRLEFSFYNSPVPASFMRTGASLPPGENPTLFTSPKRKAGYTATEYMSIIPGDQIGKGIVGVVHRGTLSVKTGTRTITRQVAAKFAFDKEQQGELRDEFRIYSRLVRMDVKGILPVYGLFQDMEDGPLMLLLGHGGKSLLAQEHEGPGRYTYAVTCSDSEKCVTTNHTFCIYLTLFLAVEKILPRS